jgi:hypothetical protein
MIIPWGLAILSGPFVIDHHAVGMHIRERMMIGQYAAIALLCFIAAVGIVRAVARDCAWAIGVANIIPVFLLVSSASLSLTPLLSNAHGRSEPSAANRGSQRRSPAPRRPEGRTARREAGCHPMSQYPPLGRTPDRAARTSGAIQTPCHRHRRVVEQDHPFIGSRGLFVRIGQIDPSILVFDKYDVKRDV